MACPGIGLRSASSGSRFDSHGRSTMVRSVFEDKGMMLIDVRGEDQGLCRSN